MSLVRNGCESVTVSYHIARTFCMVQNFVFFTSLIAGTKIRTYKILNTRSSTENLRAGYSLAIANILPDARGPCSTCISPMSDKRMLTHSETEKQETQLHQVTSGNLILW